jgi:hypothetical protein
MLSLEMIAERDAKAGERVRKMMHAAGHPH